MNCSGFKCPTIHGRSTRFLETVFFFILYFFLRYAGCILKKFCLHCTIQMKVTFQCCEAEVKTRLIWYAGKNSCDVFCLKTSANKTKLLGWLELSSSILRSPCLLITSCIMKNIFKKRMWIFYYIQTKGPKVSRTTDHFHTQHHQSCQQQDNGDWLI